MSAKSSRVLACSRQVPAYSVSPMRLKNTELAASAAAVSPARSEPGPLSLRLKAGLECCHMSSLNIGEH